MTGEGGPKARPGAAVIRVVRGPRAADAALLAELEPLVEAARRAPELLAAPVRIVVPSRSLREHLARALVRHFEGAVAGVAIQTLHGLARQLAERSGAEPLPDAGLFPVVVRREARRHPPLRDPLDGLDRGYAGVEAAVSDLLDASFEPALAEALEERAREAGMGPTLSERACALVRVASRCAEAVERGEIGHRSQLFRQALDALRRDPEAALPSRAVFLHGYADATGVQADLVEALMRSHAAVVILDRPLDPASDDEREEPGVAFSARFGERLAGVARPGEPRTAARSAIGVLHAPGRHAEVRGVAERVGALLDRGKTPESIGVVARDFSAHRLPLRVHFRRLAIPFSGIGERGPVGPGGRRILALLDLLRLGVRAPAERWLDAAVALSGDLRLEATRRADLRVAFHARGAARLFEVAALEAPKEKRAIALPVRRGLAAPNEESARAVPRRLPAAVFASALGAARDLCARLETWPEADTLRAHRNRLGALVAESLHWSPGDPGCGELRGVLAGDASRPADFHLTAEDFLLTLECDLDGAGSETLGGEGAGVQVLNVMEARGRTFDHLFVLGLERDAFPRSITEDPLLPDRMRRALREVLPDLPVKSDGFEEERFLFAQLVAASPEVTLSCALADDDGKARQPSPLLERLRLTARVAAPRAVAALHAPAGAEERPRTADEHALLAGLYGGRKHFGRVLDVALAEARAELSLGAAPGLAAGRLAVLDELDAPAPRLPGPYFGFIGAPRDPADPRHKRLYITALEAVARCPWNAFLGRLLRLELVPDAFDALPAVTPLALGAVVHAVLEEVARAVQGERARTLEEALAGEPTPVRWPPPDALERMLQECAERVAAEQGVGLPGFARALALRARSHLEVARALDWPAADSEVPVLGVEVEGSVGLGGGRVIHFRADRVDRTAEGLLLVDYKTGRPLSTAAKEDTRRRHLLAGIESGLQLQAAAYARAAPDAAEGRYVYLRPDLDDRCRALGAPAVDAELTAAFEASAGAVFAAWETGAFFPRLLAANGEEPHACQSCDVKEACLRGNSGARARLAAWEAAREEKPPSRDAERAMLALWKRGPAS